MFDDNFSKISLHSFLAFENAASISSHNKILTFTPSFALSAMTYQKFEKI